MQQPTSLTVRLGRFVVGGILKAKSLALRGARRVRPGITWVGRVILRALVPGYRGVFLIQRKMMHMYRPVKHRLMFLVSNRFSLWVMMVLIVVFTATMNSGRYTARAESDVPGQQSILYALIVDRPAEIIDEVVDVTALGEYHDMTMQDDVVLRAEAPLEVVTLTDLQDEGVVTDFAILSPEQQEKMRIRETSASSSQATQVAAPRTGIIAYTVESGDTLSGIAKKFSLSLNTLLWANNLTQKSVLKLGQQLTILPVSGVTHTVKSGDTILGIAKKYGVDTSTILAYNNISSSDALKIGQEFIIPGGSPIATSVPPRSSTAVATTTIKDIFTSAPSGSGGTRTPGSGMSMVWPTDLSYIVRGLGWKHTGYDIDCDGHANGTSTNDNYAAADGTVTYAGVRNGYGNTVEIDHGNGLKTRYGHFYSLYVHTGDEVSAGDALGRCGSTGNSSGTHLHFEVIDIATKKFLNPADYIRR